MYVLSGNAFLIAGTSDDLPAVLGLLAEEGIETRANPDLYVRSHRQFGIEDAHDLRARASSRAIGERRVFVISAASVTSEAQNALLKTLEEPPADALFVFLIPAPEMLLATVRSRAQIVRLVPSESSGRKEADVGRHSVDAGSFLAAAPASRIDMLKTILKKDDDDKYDTGAVLAFLSSLEKYVAGMKDRVAMKEMLDSIYKARMYVTDRGALVKTLLESVALLAPVL